MSNAPKRISEMTGEELMDWWFANKLDPESAWAALRDAILAERDAEWEARLDALVKENADLRVALRTAEQERDAAKADALYAVQNADRAIDARLAAESALGEARREGFVEGMNYVLRQCELRPALEPWIVRAIVEQKLREYPANPSGEGVTSCNRCGRNQGHGACECATPQPKATGSVGQSVRLYLAIDGAYQVVEFDASDARRLLALAQTTTEGRANG